MRAIDAYFESSEECRFFPVDRITVEFVDASRHGSDYGRILSRDYRESHASLAGAELTRACRTALCACWALDVRVRIEMRSGGSIELSAGVDDYEYEKTNLLYSFRRLPSVRSICAGTDPLFMLGVFIDWLAFFFHVPNELRAAYLVEVACVPG